MGKDVKAGRSRVRELMDLKLSALEMDIKLQLIQELIPLGLMHIAEILTEEVKTLAGDRYKRNGKPGHVRWAKQWGSVYIGEQKLPILYQRVRDRKKCREVELRPYKSLQEPRLNRIRGYKYLPELRTAIQMELGIKAEEVVAA